MRHGDEDVLGMFEKYLSNARIRVFFGQEHEGERRSTLISTKDIKKVKSIVRDIKNRTETKLNRIQFFW